MPNLFSVGSYRIFFWANENNEPIHVHVAKGKPSPNATKLWLTQDGGCVLANNSGKIPDSDLTQIMDIISSEFFSICAAWKKFFAIDEVKFYC